MDHTMSMVIWTILDVNVSISFRKTTAAMVNKFVSIKYLLDGIHPS